MKKLLSILLAALLAAAAFPTFAKEAEAPKQIANDVAIDTYGNDGYTGDYVVIYNPNTSTSNAMSTGTLTGLIETEIEPDLTGPAAVKDDARPYRIDVDPILAEQAAEKGYVNPPEAVREEAQVSYNVGDTRNFTIMNYSPAGYSMQFKVLARGEHCYIWTPTSTASNVWPLDAIDESYAEIAAAEFDSKFELMQASFGNHSNGSQGDGRLHMLYYNIDDGWQPGQGYIGGYFTAMDLFINGLPILNIDTYPGVHYVTTSGEEINDLTSTFNTMVHEYQHLINYSEAGMTDTWINECMSAAAEELCYPGSSVVSRIQSWTNYFYRQNDDWLTPRSEFEYVPAFSLHNGFSMYDWNNDLDMDDLLVLYAQVSLFAQYIFTQYGNTTFRGIMQELAAGRNFVQGFQNVTGQSTSEFVGNFRAALTANTAPNVLGGVYGFVPQEGYDPAQYHDVANPYSLLGPVVFTGTSCSIKGGGAICVKPVGGVFNPPSGANSGLRYYGVTRSVEEPEPVPLTGVGIFPSNIEIELGDDVTLTAYTDPENANDYTLSWSVSDPSILSIAPNVHNEAVVTGLAVGSATVTVTAHDNVSGGTFTGSATVTVVRGNEYLPGDVNMDGSVTATDAILALRYGMGLIDLADLQQEIADVNGDGQATTTDALIILRMAMNLI